MTEKEKMANYFTKDTDKALEAFLESDDTAEKHEIFDKKIRPAFEKLVENLIFVYGFYNIDDIDTLKREGLSNLYEMSLLKHTALLMQMVILLYHII